MLERIALHQTRLRAPGLGVDARGVALGTKGLVLLPTVDRLVALLAIYTREQSLEAILPSVALRVVRSKLGTREIVLEMAAESSDRMDRVAEAARLVQGFAFTGTSRHFVQYRDAAAPFGYDAHELMASNMPLVLYHDRFTQEYEVERDLDLKALLMRLHLERDPPSLAQPGLRVVVAEHGLSAALIHYLVRSRVEGEVAACEWPPASAFDDGPTRRIVVRVPDLPPRMLPLLGHTPGLSTFLPAAPGVFVEAGFRHPVELRACPVFDPGGLVLLRGRGEEPWALPRVPVMGDLRAFARITLRDANDGALAQMAERSTTPDVVRVPLRVLPSLAPWRRVTVTWVAPADMALLRRVAYALPRSVVAATRIAHTNRGAFLHTEGGVENIPVGTFFSELHPNLFVAAGFDVVPQVAPEVLVRAMGVPPGTRVLLTGDGNALGVPIEAFGPLEDTLLDGAGFEPLTANAVARALELSTLELAIEPIGALPLRGTKPVASAPPALPERAGAPEDE